MTQGKPVNQIPQRAARGTGHRSPDHGDHLPDHLPRWLEAVSGGSPPTWELCSEASSLTCAEATAGSCR